MKIEPPLSRLFSLLLAMGLLLSSALCALGAAPGDDDDKKKDRDRRPAATRQADPPRREAPRANPPPPRVEAPKPRVEMPRPPVVRPEPRREIPKPPPIVAKPAPAGRVALADPPKRDDQPKRDNPPRVERPKFEPPKVDRPKIDPPKPERPKIEPPKAGNPPKIDPPKIEPPKTVQPKFDLPKEGKHGHDAPKGDSPKIDPPKIDKPKLDLPPKVDPGVFKPKLDGQPKTGDKDADRLRDRNFGDNPRPKIGDKPGDKHIDKPGEPPLDIHPAGGVPALGKPGDKHIDKPGDKPGDRHVDKPGEKPLDIHPGQGKPGIGKPGIGKPGITNPGIANPGIANPAGILPGMIPGGSKHPGDGLRHGDDHDRNGHLPIDPADAAKHNFSERVKSGDIDHLTKGKFAEQVGLRDQYKMSPQGDIARRMNLEKHVNVMADKHVTNVHIDNNVANIYHRDRPYYHGVIGPNYTHDCFRYNYFGPSFYAGLCWYPNWGGWVDWSWHHHCHPIWDPRPFWCRPVIYEPAPVWIYYQVPVWRPLPTVACGTWVDVQPEVVKEKYDLQLLAVRFVDPGHPAEKLGPRYRVWFRNNSDKPITEPFSVSAFAANDEQLVKDLPQSGVRVTSIDPGDTQSVDIRLPVESLTLGKDDEGKPGPFAALHVIVDSNREIEETNRENNGVCLKTGDVLPVDPAAFGAKPSSAAAGDELVVAGEGFGPLPGQVIVRMGELEFDAEIRGWYDLGARFMLPNVRLAKETEAEVIVIRGDSAAANPIKISVFPPRAAEKLEPAAEEGPRLQ